MAGRVECLYCGKEIPDNVSHCPHCGAVSHFQRKGYRAGARRQFFLYLVLVVLIGILMALWLPHF
jgi:predicted nucleic acid-binding Zn ribbon protein